MVWALTNSGRNETEKAEPETLGWDRLQRTKKRSQGPKGLSLLMFLLLFGGTLWDQTEKEKCRRLIRFSDSGCRRGPQPESRESETLASALNQSWGLSNLWFRARRVSQGPQLVLAFVGSVAAGISSSNPLGPPATIRTERRTKGPRHASRRLLQLCRVCPRLPLPFKQPGPPTT